MPHDRRGRSSRAAVLGACLLASAAGPARAQGPTITLEPRFTIPGEHPTAMASANDGSGRLFIATQEGRIHIYDGTALRPVPFLDLGTPGFGEEGLLGLAFHPGYGQNGLFFIYFAAGNQSFVVRYQVSADDPDRAEPSSARTLLTSTQAFNFHFGGHLAFGPDGFLYVSLGDGGDAARAQSLDSWSGKILRIDPDITDAVPYRIPPDNPFLGQPGALSEIWALGLRNPWRFSFDRLTGELFIADVGEFSYEEVDVVAAGGGHNFGWPRMEGPFCLDPPADCNDGSLTLPSFGYGHEAGDCSITGGYRYRGPSSGDLQGTYLYSDFCTGRLWGAAESGGSWTVTALAHEPSMFSTFGEDEVGEVYAADYVSGTVFRIVGTPGVVLGVSDPAPLPESAFEAVFEVSLSAPSPRTVAVRYHTLGSPLSHELQEGRLEFMPGETLKLVRVRLLDDTADEPGDFVSVVLSDPELASIGDGVGTVTVEDDDPPPAPVVEGCTVPESAGVCVFTVTLSAASGNTVAFAYATVDESAGQGTDYEATAGTLVFAPGETVRTIAVPILDDAEIEPTESFGLELTPLDPGGFPSRAGGFIENDDQTPSDPPVLIAPVGSITTATPAFRWRPVSQATRYRLRVQRGALFLEHEFEAASVCPEDCEVTLDTGLPREEGMPFYQWELTAGNASGFGPPAAQMFEVELPLHLLMTAAGTGTPGYSGDGGWALGARIEAPQGVAAAPGGTLFIAEGNRVRRVEPGETIATLAGNGQAGCGPDGGLASETSLPPVRVPTLSPNFNLYFGTFSATGECSQVRWVTLGNELIFTIAGVTGPGGFAGDGGPATSALLGNEIGGLAVDAANNVFIADSANRRIRRVDFATGIIDTIAGTGEPVSGGDGGPALAAGFAYPKGLALDAEGNLYVADPTAHRVRRIDAASGIITTVAGDGVDGTEGDGGPAVAARLSQPSSLTLDAAGNLWIGDEQAGRVRFVDLARGIISTMAGGGESILDGVPPAEARLRTPLGVAVDGRGNLFIADSQAYRVRKVDNRVPLAFAAPVPRAEAGEPVTLDATSSIDLDADALDFDWRDGTRLLGSGALLRTTLDAGERTVTLTARDGFGGTARATTSVTVDPAEPPVVSNVSHENATIPVGVPVTFQWSATDNGTLAGFDLSFSADEGLTFQPVDGCAGLPGDFRECTWPSPGPVTSQGRLRVEARDRAGLSGFAEVPLDIASVEPPPGTGTGLRGEYYDSRHLTHLKLVRIDPVVDFDWGTGSPAPSIGANTFSARWTGLVEPRFSETYTFETASDDGVRLWVDGRLLIDDWTSHGPRTRTGTIELSAGRKYDLRLEYFEDTGSAAVALLWASASQALQAVPLSQLYPSLLYENFDDGVADGWRTVSGSWSIRTDGTPVLRSSPQPAVARAVAGSADWGDYRAESRVKVASWGSTTSRTVGLLARYRDPDNHLSFVFEQGQWRIKKEVAGRSTVLASTAASFVTGRWYTLRARLEGPQLELFVDGVRVLSALDSSLLSGRAGAVSRQGDSRFDEFLVTP